MVIMNEETAGNCIIKIKDDGIGFNSFLIKEEGRTHTGIENVRNRPQLLCNVTLDIQSEINVGTTITITIPQKNENNCSR